MKKIFLDFETYYAKDYSLRFMTPIEYILDKRFEMICCGIGVNDAPPFVLKQEEIIDALRDIDEPYAAISHNALFDMCILAYRYDIHPPVMIDTMAMARAALVHEIPSGKVSLASIMAHLNLGKKTNVIDDMDGIHFRDVFNHNDLWKRFTEYNINDVNGCRGIYNYLLPSFTPQEFHIMDTVIRMATDMRIIADLTKLSQHYHEVVWKRKQLLERWGGEGFRPSLMSNEKFADLLEQHGVDPPKKVSKTTSKETYAFAKTDAEFIALLEHEDEEVQALVAARLGNKTTIEETRSKRFMFIIDATIGSYHQPLMPVPLRYSGTHTHRLSGDWKLNMQNLSVRKNKAIRSALFAPPNHVILAVDASQIEARLTAWLAGQKDLLDMFKKGIDIYKDFAADIYNVSIEQVNKLQRFNGKTCILGLGFGMGDKRLLYTLENGARDAGIEATYELAECRVWMNRYRTRFENIPDLWAKAQNTIFLMWKEFVDEIDKLDLSKSMVQGRKFGPCNVDQLSIVLPSKLRIWYHNLTRESGEYWYQYGREWKKIYGGKFVENIVQALDRQHVLEAALRTEYYCEKEGIPGMTIAMQVHDENVYVVHEDQLSIVKEIALREMARSPTWALDIPFAAEAKVGYNYGELE